MNPQCPSLISIFNLLILTKIEAKTTAIIAEYWKENSLKVNSVVIVLPVAKM